MYNSFEYMYVNKNLYVNDICGLNEIFDMQYLKNHMKVRYINNECKISNSFIKEHGL